MPERVAGRKDDLRPPGNVKAIAVCVRAHGVAALPPTALP
jgi:hypothetical protein